MSYSFAPDGTWFVFEIATGKTIKKNLSRRAVRSFYYGGMR